VPELALRDLMALSFDQIGGGIPAPWGGNAFARYRTQMPALWAWRVAGILFLIAIEAVLYGFSYPFFSLALEKYGLSNWAIGLNASLAGAGILLVGPFLPRAIAFLGLRDLVAGLFFVSLLSFGALLVVDAVAVWFVARFVMGACFAALWSTTEIWLNGAVDDRHRGRIIGASATLYAGAQFLGPMALSVTGVIGLMPLLAAMLPLAVGVAVALCIRSPAEVREDSRSDGIEGAAFVFALAGSLIAMSFLAGVLETSMQSLLPIYGLAHGLTDAGASRMVALFSFGEAILVALIGFMADRLGRERTLKLCILPILLVVVALPASIFHISLLGPALFVAGGAISGVYTLGVIQIGQEFRGGRLATVSTGFAMAYAAGAVVGSTPIGLAIDIFGTNALPILVAGGFCALAGLIVVRARNRAVAEAAMWVPIAASEEAVDIGPATEITEPTAGSSGERQELDLEESFRQRASDLARRRAQEQRMATERSAPTHDKAA
jgi:MFS family permease